MKISRRLPAPMLQRTQTDNEVAQRFQQTMLQRLQTQFVHSNEQLTKMLSQQMEKSRLQQAVPHQRQQRDHAQRADRGGQVFISDGTVVTGRKKQNGGDIQGRISTFT